MTIPNAGVQEGRMRHWLVTVLVPVNAWDASEAADLALQPECLRYADVESVEEEP